MLLITQIIRRLAGEPCRQSLDGTSVIAAEKRYIRSPHDPDHSNRKHRDCETQTANETAGHHFQSELTVVRILLDHLWDGVAFATKRHQRKTLHKTQQEPSK